MTPEELERLAGWLASQGIASGPVEDVTMLSGGTQNQLLRFRVGSKGFVLRAPSPNARPGTDRILAREALVLAALRETQVPHARFHGSTDDISIIGVPFLITDAVPGFNAAVEMPGKAGSDPAFRHHMGLSMVDGIVALAAVDHEAVGLGDFGRLSDFIERQVPRWAKQLASYESHAGWPGPDSLKGVEQLGQWLDANRPSVWRQGLMHGDYHIGNVLFDAETGDLTAMLDWELAALGDPMLDLGRLLAAWPDPDGNGPLSLKVEPWGGFPARDALIERYALGTGRDMGNLLWYEVLACYKLGIILEGTFARACAGLAGRDVGDRLHQSAVALIARALRWLEQRG